MKRLAHGQWTTAIIGRVQDQGRRLYLAGMSQRTVLTHRVGNFPGTPSERPLGPALQVTQRPHHGQVRNRILGHRSLETFGLTDQPTGHIPAVTAPVNKELILIHDALFNEMIHTRQDVSHIAAAKIAAVGIQESQAVTEAAAKVRLEDGVSL